MQAAPGAHWELSLKEVHDTHADHALLYVKAEVEVVGQHIPQAACDEVVLSLDGRVTPADCANYVHICTTSSKV